MAAAAAAHAAQTAASMSSQNSTTRRLESKKHFSAYEVNNEVLVDNREEVESTTMDCIQCQAVARKSIPGECKSSDFSSLPRPDICSVHNTRIEGVGVKNGIDSKPPPALKFSVNAILARAAQAGSSNTGNILGDNDSLSEDTDHPGSEGTGASSDHDNIQNHLSRMSQDSKQQDINNCPSPCSTISTSINTATMANATMSSHPYMLGPCLTSVMSGATSLAKPVPRPLGTSPLFNSGSSPLQALLYRHPYLNTAGIIIIILFIFAPQGEQPEAAAGGREV